MKSILLFFASCFVWTSPEPPTVNKIIKDVPDQLIQQTLLLPRFVEYTKETAPEGMPDSYLKLNNREAKRCNETILELAERNYPFKVKLIDFSEIESHKEQGHHYFLDMVLMPKQLTEAKKEAMVPCYIKYKSPQHMFTNKYVQFHYYFYVRDLDTQDAYVGTKLKGNEEAFVSMNKFFKQLTKDLAQ